MGRSGRKLDNEAVTLGKNLAHLRRDRGLTQVEVAEKLGIPQSMISQYERGDLRLHGQLIVRLARILSVSADAILGLREPDNEELSILRPFVRRLRQIPRLSRRQQRALLVTIDAFLGRTDLKKTA